MATLEPVSIFLCGFMGSGKTAAGKVAAKKWGLHFADLDEEIESFAGKTIPEIFAQDGEAYFRTIESNVLATMIFTPSQRGAIIALGGGAIINQENAAKINNHGILVFIDVSFNTCYQRIKDDFNRPLVQEKSRKELKRLYNDRRKIYVKHAEFAVNGNTGIDTLAERILDIHGYL